MPKFIQYLTGNLIVILFFPCLGSAKELYYKNTSLLSRGGWSLGHIEDLESAIWYNPSLLYYNEKFKINLEIQAFASEDALKLIENPPVKIEQGQYQSTLDPYFGTYNRVQPQANLYIFYKDWALIPYGALAMGQLSLSNKVFPEAEGSIFIDKGTTLAKAFNINSRLKGGVSLRYVSRDIHEGEVSALKFDEGLVEKIDSGHAWSLSGGLNYLLEESSSSILGLSYLNINNPSFSNLSVNGAWGNRLKPELNLGFSSKFLLNSYGRWGFDLRNITGDELFLNRIFLGVELNPRPWFTLNAGLSQLYWNLGTSIKLWKILKLDAGYYGENAYNYYRKETRNMSLGLSLGWNL